MKKIINYLIIVIALILFIPTVKAAEVTTTYTNYYFFLEPYKESDIEEVIKKGETTNYTAFPPLENGIKKFKNALPIELTINCTEEKEKNDDCWNYSTFYQKYADIESKGTKVEYNIDDTSHESKVIEGDENKKYYLHGSYYSNGEWKKTESLTTNGIGGFNFITKFSCASIYPSNINLVPVDYELHKNPNINNLDSFYIEIDRTFNEGSFNNINWDFTYEKEKNYSTCPLIEGNQILAFAYNNSPAEIYSPVVYKYEYTVTENKCNVSEPNDKELSCNNNLTLNSKCDKLTITTDNYSADVTIEQKGTLNSLLTPDKLFAGGGFKFGLIYTNEISWDYVDSSQNNEIEEKMKNKLKELTDFENNINLSNVTFNGEIIDASLFEKKCYQKGEFTAGNTLTTTCTFFLPKSKMDEYTGIVKYGEGTDNGINNKYYTKLSDNGEYEITAKLENMSIIKENAAKSDSATEGKSWTGDWNVTLKDCNINVYPLLIGKFKFIYRPIDIRNPFPSRNPGINWYDWYKESSNKERLEKTYSNLNYTVNIDNKKLTEVKEYNKDRSYFDFDTMEHDKSTFLEKYFPNAKVGGD